MFHPKPISQDSVAGALAKAERYRLLNEPGEAESICLDILDIEPENQQALISLILALTDQLTETPGSFEQAMSATVRLTSPYERAYYGGIAWERRAKARSRSHGSAGYVYEWLHQAMELFEQATTLRPAANDDAILRWNACARFLNNHPEITSPVQEMPECILSE